MCVPIVPNICFEQFHSGSYSDPLFSTVFVRPVRSAEFVKWVTIPDHAASANLYSYVGRWI